MRDGFHVTFRFEAMVSTSSSVRSSGLQGIIERLAIAQACLLLQRGGSVELARLDMRCYLGHACLLLQRGGSVELARLDMRCYLGHACSSGPSYVGLHTAFPSTWRVWRDARAIICPADQPS